LADGERQYFRRSCSTSGSGKEAADSSEDVRQQLPAEADVVIIGFAIIFLKAARGLGSERGIFFILLIFSFHHFTGGPQRLTCFCHNLPYYEN
jgi:hypothetical protein